METALDSESGEDINIEDVTNDSKLTHCWDENACKFFHVSNVG